MIFENMLKDSESLFIDDIALSFEYIPKILKCRENEQQYIAACIKPILQNRTGKNVLVTGPPGIGKTCATQWILRELKDTTDILPIYINCWKKDTSFKIIAEICSQLDYKWLQDKKTDELLKSILPLLNKKPIVLVLDEIDKLSEFQLFYTLLEDLYKKTIILITNEEHFLSGLDSRIKSRLIPEIIKFRPYSLDETKQILKQRMEYAFVKNCFSLEALNIIADKSFELEDIRTGLHLMKESGLLAESESLKNITLVHAEKAISKLKDFKSAKSSDLTDSEKHILDFIKKNSGLSVKELYDIYSKKNETPYRTFFRKIKNFEKLKIISLEEIPSKSSIITFGVKKLTDFK